MHHGVPYLYDIPLRACVSSTIENLMFAGRNISATHIAFASTRTMATCAVIGQGVGTAAAYSAMHEVLPSELSNNEQATNAIQQQLLEDDAFLISRTNGSQRDFALRAKVTASSELPQGAATNAVSGPTRSAHGTGGAPPGRTPAGTHRWMSDPSAGLPPWIQCEWREPISPSRLQLIFDTGMHRVLTYSLADSYTQKMLWGKPQPETVCDYRVEAMYRGEWRVVASVQANYQRRNLVKLDGSPIDAVRITVDSTNGLDHARICEIRIV